MARAFANHNLRSPSPSHPRHAELRDSRRANSAMADNLLCWEFGSSGSSHSDHEVVKRSLPRKLSRLTKRIEEPLSRSVPERPSSGRKSMVYGLSPLGRRLLCPSPLHRAVSTIHPRLLLKSAPGSRVIAESVAALANWRSGSPLIARPRPEYRAGLALGFWRSYPLKELVNYLVHNGGGEWRRASIALASFMTSSIE